MSRYEHAGFGHSARLYIVYGPDIQGKPRVRAAKHSLIDKLVLLPNRV